MLHNFPDLSHKEIATLIGSAKTPVPAAISTAALNSINGLALVELAIKVTLNNKSNQELNNFLKQISKYKNELYQLADKDCQSWDQETKTFKKELLINTPYRAAPAPDLLESLGLIPDHLEPVHRHIHARVPRLFLIR